MKTEKIKASSVKQLSLFNSRSNLTAFKTAAFFLSGLKISALSEQFKFKTQRIFKWGDRRNEVTCQQWRGTGLGYNCSQGSLQNKLLGIDKQARGLEPGEAGRAMAMHQHISPASGEGRLGRMLSTVTPHQILLKCSKMEIKPVLSGTCQTAAIRQKEPILFSSATVIQVTHRTETCS